MIRPARRAAAKHHRAARQSLLRPAGEVAKDTCAAVEDAELLWQEDAGGLHEGDDGEGVLGCDLRDTVLLEDGVLVPGSRGQGGDMGEDQAGAAADEAYARE